MKRLPLLCTLLALVLLSASVAYWVLQLYKPAQRPLAAAPVATLPEPAIDAAASLFGGQAAASVATNYQLTGVVAAGRESVAIIVADGGMPKALKLGKEVANGVTVAEVHPRYVMLSDGGVKKRIELATDTKSSGQSVPVPPPVQMPPPQNPNPPALQSAPSMTGGTPSPPPPQPVQMAPPTRSVGTQGGAPLQ